MAYENLALVLFVVIGTVSLFYQNIGRDLLVQIGYGNNVQPISDFPYTCRRLRDPGFEACEDMWLSENTRQLFMACSSSLARKDWMPNIHRLNASGRSTTDKIIVLEIDKPLHENSFVHRTIFTPGYTGVNNDGRLSLVAINGVDHADHIDLYVNNNRPSIDPSTGELLDNDQVGANSTIELFRIDNPTYPASVAKFVRTYAHPQIATPNRIAPTTSGSFFFTNDHGVNKRGLWHHLSPFIKTGDVSYCSASGDCRRLEKGFAFPNGLVLGKKDNLLFVPSTSAGTITVYRPQPEKDNELKIVDVIKIGYPLDNISEDANGDYFVAAFPKFLEVLPAFDDPLSTTQGPSAVFKITKKQDGTRGYYISKVIEDAKGEVLPVSTVAVHDAKTGRLFLGGVVSPFITVCDPK